MSQTANPGDDLRVDVPDAASGVMLAERLGHGCGLAGSESEGWVVAGRPNGDLPNILAEIQRWLRDEAIDRVTVHVGEHSHSMSRD